jgi:hypothetical protein
MTSSATFRASKSSATSATEERLGRAERVDEIMKFVDTQRMVKKYTPGWFGEVETELRKKMLELERELTAEIMTAHDIDAGAIEVFGKAHRRVLRAAQTYVTKAGPITVERWLYRDRTDDEAKSVSPMELRLGIVGEFWTEKAAKTALWIVAQMTPQKAEELFERVEGGMQPSKSSLDRLPKLVSERWESEREEYEAALRDAIVIPEGAVSVAVSIDGVMAPMEGTKPVEKRNAAADEGRICKVKSRFLCDCLKGKHRDSSSVIGQAAAA